jgi:hypothetical protein
MNVEPDVVVEGENHGRKQKTDELKTARRRR